MSNLKDELAKLSGLIVGKNVLQSPLDFWGRYDVWRDVTKGLEEAIKEMEEKYGHIRENTGRDKGSIT